MKISYKKRLVIAGLLLFCILGLHFSGVDTYLTLERIKENIWYLQWMVQMHYVPSVLFYITIFIGATIFYIPITVLLTILAGFLFGTFVGCFYATISATIGSTILFLLIRYLLGDIIQKRFARRLVEFNKEIEEYGPLYLLMIQLLPITPTFLINTLAGLTKLSLWSFIWTTYIGIFPGSLIYTFAGQQLHTISSVRDILSMPMILVLVALALLAILPVILKYVRKYMKTR